MVAIAPVVAQSQERRDEAGRAATSAEVPRLRVGTPRSPIRLDGVLDEPAWVLVDSIADLRQVEPREGGQASARTVVRVLAEGDALVIGIRADDPDPLHLTAFSRQRDADLEDEDHVRIVIDSYLDARSGYVFAVNPFGARYDALVTRQGEDDNSNWDAVWEARAARSATGWSVEIRIPARSLLFRQGLTEWGFNVERRIQRLQETDRWASPVQDIEITNPSRAGRLVDIPPFELGLGLTVRPAVTASSAREAPATGRDATGDAEPRRHPACRRQRPGVAHGQHRLRRDRGGQPADQPHPLPARLPREADLLPRGVGHLRLRARHRETTCAPSSAGASA